MLKKLVLVLLLLTFTVIMFVPIQNRVIYYSLYLLMIVWVLLFKFLEDSVSLREVERKLGKSDLFSIKAGYIYMDGPVCVLSKGLLVVDEGNVLFYKRDRATRAKLEYSFSVDSISGYSLGKVDEFHLGITFTLDDGRNEVKFEGKDFQKRERELRKAFGWPEES